MIDRLEMFIILAREEHFGRAAEQCNVSQPTFSSNIKQLEDQLGTRLVERGARFQGLTLEGEKVLQWAKRIVGDYRTMHSQLAAAKKGLGGTIRLAVIPTALGMVQDLTAPFQNQHPHVNFTILSKSSSKILELISNLEADLGISYLENEPLGEVISVPLYKEQYRFVTADTGIFKNRKNITWAEANQVPLCLLTPDMQNRRIINRYMAQSGTEPKPTVQTSSMITMAAHIKTGQWSGILPEKLVTMLAHDQKLRTLPLTKPEGSQLVGAIAIKREPRTPVVEALLRHARLMSQTGVR